MSILCKCDAGMSVEKLCAVVNIETLKGPFMELKFSTGWAVGLVTSVKKKKSERTKKLNKEDYAINRLRLRFLTG